MAKFPFKDLREWIEFLEEKGELARNKEEVSLKGEVASISEKIARTGGKAVLHENIKGYPGWRIFSDGLTTRQRIAWALGLMPEEMGQKIGAIKDADLVKAKKIETAPCKELKCFGDDVDMIKFPIPYSSEFDIPPFITAGVVVTKDPDTGWHNSGITRVQLQGKALMTNLLQRGQHGSMIINKYWERGQEWAPIAQVIGTDPLYYLCSQMSAPTQIDEWDYWGAFTGQPFEVVKCETNDIMVPASAEIVIEGEISKTERILEGPFSEFTGFYSGCRWVSAFRVKAVTMRKNPIYQYLKMGKEPNEGLNFTNFMIESQLFRQVKALIPEISGVHCITGMGTTTAVSVPKEARIKKPGLVRVIGMTVRAVQAGKWVKNLFVVDDDVNIQSHHDLLWAMSMRFQGVNDITVIPDITGTDLDPSEASLGKGAAHTSYTIFDCTEPLYPYDEAYRRGLAKPASDEIIKSVEVKWADYGF